MNNMFITFLNARPDELSYIHSSVEVSFLGIENTPATVVKNEDGDQVITFHNRDFYIDFLDIVLPIISVAVKIYKFDTQKTLLLDSISEKNKKIVNGFSFDGDNLVLDLGERIIDAMYNEVHKN